MADTASVTRRGFIKTGAGVAGALVVGFRLPEGGPRIAAAAAPADALAPNAFVRIGADETVTVIVGKSEMGQGVYTSLPMLIAEELDADWAQMRVESAPATPEFAHTAFGIQVTGGSTSVSSSWQQYREAGATARALLVGAAAKRWGVSPDALRTEAGHVIDGGGRRLSYGALTAEAAAMPAPESVQLKDPSEFRLIGTDVRRLEGPAKVTGRAEFGIDVQRPGLRTAVVARPPVCGGKAARFDAKDALAIDGVERVKAVPAGVAVIARDYWTAKRGRDALSVEWDDGPNSGLSSEAMRARYLELAERPGAVAEQEGDVETALGAAAKTLEATYEVPYLAHAPMEPLNCTAEVRDGRCEVWAGTQFQGSDKPTIAAQLGIEPDAVRIHTTLLGGGFGRRASPDSDFIADAVAVANGETGPVKTVWTREDDIQCGYYRPMFVHRVRAGVDASGMPSVWHQRLVGQSILTGTAFEQYMVKDGVDAVSVEGAVHMPYAIGTRQIELHSPGEGMPVLWWRSVGHTHTGFVNESVLDELAHLGGQDPFELRRRLLADHPRHLAVLELAAEKSGWGGALPEGHARGIAVRKSFDSYVAEVAEVSVDDDGSVRVHRVTCAVDCGIAVNPWNIEAQLEGSVVYALTAALYGEVTLDGGRVVQSNFHDYPMLRMGDMPAVDVHVVKSAEAPTGVGEPGVPPLAPAVCNALHTLTGKRVRKLPIRLSEAIEV